VFSETICIAVSVQIFVMKYDMSVDVLLNNGFHEVNLLIFEIVTIDLGLLK
jgi:hypothetical protein